MKYRFLDSMELDIFTICSNAEYRAKDKGPGKNTLFFLTFLTILQETKRAERNKSLRPLI